MIHGPHRLSAALALAFAQMPADEREQMERVKEAVCANPIMVVQTEPNKEAQLEAREEVEMSDATDWKQRRELADSILSILYTRFQWMKRDPMACAAADQHMAKAIETKNTAALTVEATMGAMLDALHACNEDTLERWRKYMDAAPSRIGVGS